MEEYERRRKNQSTLEEAIERFLKTTNLKSRMKQMDVVDAWGEVLGKAVANRTEKVYLRGKTLVVVMNSSVMRDELSQAKTQIIDMINAYIKEERINNIWFQ